MDDEIIRNHALKIEDTSVSIKLMKDEDTYYYICSNNPALVNQIKAEMQEPNEFESGARDEDSNFIIYNIPEFLSRFKPNGGLFKLISPDLVTIQNAQNADDDDMFSDLQDTDELEDLSDYENISDFEDLDDNFQEHEEPQPNNHAHKSVKPKNRMAQARADDQLKAKVSNYDFMTEDNITKFRETFVGKTIVENIDEDNITSLQVMSGTDDDAIELVKMSADGISTKASDDSKEDKIAAFVQAAQMLIGDDDNEDIVAFDLDCDNTQFLVDAVKAMLEAGIAVKVPSAKEDEIKGLLGDDIANEYDTRLHGAECKLNNNNGPRM